MKFRKFYYITDWEWFFIIPTIEIVKNEPQYFDKNFSIKFHCFGFHFKWFFIKEGKEAE